MQSMIRLRKPIAMTSKQNLAICNQGRPTLYSDDLGTRLCELLAEGNTLSSICKEHPDLPSERTIRRWALDPEHPFSPQYARAREVGYHKMADDLLDIADSDETEPGSVARDRLRTDSRKWLLSKALPKIYGDKIELSGNLSLTHEDRLKAIEDAANGTGE
jgi:hypothetical protein